MSNDGIIPAYAGSTSRRGRRFPAVGDHPRVCGEHSTKMVMAATRMGSSPRMRGAPALVPAPGQADGIIPAYAGSTHRGRDHQGREGDHPRVCGEHLAEKAKADWGDGSSPRMRGAHPERSFFRPSKVGSSPRMRGAQAAPGNREPAGRIIPAYAGSTLKYLVRYEQTSSFSFTSQGSKPPDIIAERPSNHPFLSAEFPCAVILARFAPTFLRRPCERGFFCSARPPNQLQAVAVDRLPVRLMNLERHVLLVRRRINHDCAPLFGKRPNP